MFSKLGKEGWSTPKKLLPNFKYSNNDPFLSPDEKKLFFISHLQSSTDATTNDIDIWYVEREAEGWSEPINAGENINSDMNEYYISFTTTNRMYFSTNKTEEKLYMNNFDIYYSDFKNGTFQPAVKLGEAINTDDYEADVFVAPDESYLIFCAIRKEGKGQGDLYISFKNKKGEWTKAQNMGKSINTFNHELCPFVTADGNYFFYTSNNDIYWVDAKIIDTYR